MKTLDLYITKVCNLNCAYCYVDLVDKESPFKFNTFKKRINLLKYDHIKFFGGEPLLKWKDIKNIVISVKEKKKEIKFTIVTNGVLLDKTKLLFCLENDIEVVISFHYKGFKSLIHKVQDFLFAERILGFSFIFELSKIDFPYKIIFLLQKIGFTNFLLSPEIYSNWNKKNINILENELNKFKILFSINKKINFKGLDGSHLKEIIKGCEKDIIGKEGEKYLCNRFNDIDKLNKFNYKYIFNKYNEVIDFDNNKNKWFYICPIGWFLDSLNIKEDINERILQFKSLNDVFIMFFKDINNIKGKLNFLSDNINEIRFNLTLQCNIRCKYCYIDFQNEKIDIKVAKNIIDFFIFQDGTNKTISFFGGEPLLEFDLLKELVLYSIKIAKTKNKYISFTIATNFLLVNEEKILFLKDNNFKVHISFNGKSEINNLMRDNSTSLLLNNLEKYSNIISKENIIILLAFSNIEVGNLYNNVKYLNNLGLNNISLEIIFGIEYLWGKKEISILKSELIKIRESLFYGNIILMNIKEKNKYLDIGVNGEAQENSFLFNDYKVNFKIKSIFEYLIKSIF